MKEKIKNSKYLKYTTVMLITKLYKYQLIIYTYAILNENNLSKLFAYKIDRFKNIP